MINQAMDMEVDHDVAGAVNNAAAAAAPNGINGDDRGFIPFGGNYNEIHVAPLNDFERKLWIARLTNLAAVYELSTALAPSMIQTVWQESSRGISMEHLMALNDITVNGMRFEDLLKYRKFDACTLISDDNLPDIEVPTIGFPHACFWFVAKPRFGDRPRGLFSLIEDVGTVLDLPPDEPGISTGLELVRSVERFRAAYNGRAPHQAEKNFITDSIGFEMMEYYTKDTTRLADLFGRSSQLYEHAWDYVAYINYRVRPILERQKPNDLELAREAVLACMEGDEDRAFVLGAFIAIPHELMYGDSRRATALVMQVEEELAFGGTDERAQDEHAQDVRWYDLLPHDVAIRRFEVFLVKIYHLIRSILDVHLRMHPMHPERDTRTPERIRLDEENVPTRGEWHSISRCLFFDGPRNERHSPLAINTADGNYVRSPLGEKIEYMREHWPGALRPLFPIMNRQYTYPIIMHVPMQYDYQHRSYSPWLRGFVGIPHPSDGPVAMMTMAVRRYGEREWISQINECQHSDVNPRWDETHPRYNLRRANDPGQQIFEEDHMAEAISAWSVYYRDIHSMPLSNGRELDIIQDYDQDYGGRRILPLNVDLREWYA